MTGGYQDGGLDAEVQCVKEKVSSESTPSTWGNPIHYPSLGVKVLAIQNT
jgi:hypothetical protein